MSKENQKAADSPDDNEEQFVAVEVDEKGNPIQQSQQQAADDTQDEDDQHDDVDGADDDEDSEDDERVGHSEDDDEGGTAGESVEEKRERRRRENKAKRVRNRAAAQAKDRLLREQGQAILNMQEQIASLQGRTVQYDLNALQGKLQEIQDQQHQAKTVMAKLVKAQDGEGVAEITQLQIQLTEQHRLVSEQLARAKKHAQQHQGGNGREQPDDQRGGRKPAPLPPEVQERALEWAEGNKSWFSGASQEDKATVVRLDKAIMDAGFDPQSDAYWRELDRRVRINLPHHFKKANGSGRGNGGTKVNDNNNTPRQNSGGPRMAASSQGGARPLGKNEVRVTPERRKAMEEAGIWNNPEKRNRQLAAYAKWDRENAAQ